MPKNRKIFSNCAIVVLWEYSEFAFCTANKKHQKEILKKKTSFFFKMYISKNKRVQDKNKSIKLWVQQFQVGTFIV